MSDLIKHTPPPAPTVYEPQPQTIWVDGYLDEKQSEITRYLEVVWAGKWIIVGVTLVAALVAVWWTRNTPPTYQSSTRIQIESEQNVLPYQRGTAETESPLYLGTQAQVLRSQVLGRRVVQRLNLVRNPATIDNVATGFLGGLEVSLIFNSQIVRVTYTAGDPRFAAEAVNTVADEYVKYSLEVRQESAERARDFLEVERRKLQEKLEESEQQLADYGRANGILEPTEKLAEQKLTDLSQQMTSVEAELLKSQYEALRDTTPENFPEAFKTQAMRSLEGHLVGLQQKIDAARQQFGPRWPAVVALNDEIGRTRQQLAVEAKAAAAQAKLAYDLALAHRRRVASAFSDQTKQLDHLSQVSIQYNILKRQVETDRQLHDGVLQRLRETDISAGLKAANVHVIDRALVPRAPISPNPFRNYVVGIGGGFMVGLMLVLGLDFFDRTIKSGEQIERDMRLPFLGSIPAFEKSWTDITGGLLVPLTLEQQQKRLSAGLHSTNDTYWESYRALRTSVLFSSADGRPRTILVTSSLSGEGKTTTAVNLATSLAQTGARTVLIELDMRKPRLAEMFHLIANRGLSRYLSGQSSLNTEIQDSGIPNLCIVPAGPHPPNPPELIGSTRMKAGLDLLVKHFEFVILDGPPLMPVTDTLVMSPRVDGVLLVVKAGETPQALVQKSSSLLRSVGARILGVLLTGAEQQGSVYGYQSYYGGTPPAGNPSVHERLFGRRRAGNAS